jgi:hypothetical protein
MLSLFLYASVVCSVISAEYHDLGNEILLTALTNLKMKGMSAEDPFPSGRPAPMKLRGSQGPSDGWLEERIFSEYQCNGRKIASNGYKTLNCIPLSNTTSMIISCFSCKSLSLFHLFLPTHSVTASCCFSFLISFLFPTHSVWSCLL